jgi:transposase
MMVALLLYCYATGTRSSRLIMRRCYIDVAYRVFVGEVIPDFRTNSVFRKTYVVRLETLFVELLRTQQVLKYESWEASELGTGNSRYFSQSRNPPLKSQPAGVDQ